MQLFSSKTRNSRGAFAEHLLINPEGATIPYRPVGSEPYILDRATYTISRGLTGITVRVRSMPD